MAYPVPMQDPGIGQSWRKALAAFLGQQRATMRGKGLASLTKSGARPFFGGVRRGGIMGGVGGRPFFGGSRNKFGHGGVFNPGLLRALGVTNQRLPGVRPGGLLGGPFDESGNYPDSPIAYGPDYPADPLPGGGGVFTGGALGGGFPGTGAGTGLSPITDPNFNDPRGPSLFDRMIGVNSILPFLSPTILPPWPPDPLNNSLWG